MDLFVICCHPKQYIAGVMWWIGDSLKEYLNTVWVKKSPLRFSDIFPKWLEFLVQILRAY